MSDKTPIIFIPGLFGSMSSEIIPNTGPWHFGPTRYTGKRFIRQLNAYGYTLNTDLFVMFYDWRKPCTQCAFTILLPLIKRVKALTGHPKVNIVCHGTGGLVARSYAQSLEYHHDISNLVLIGTPNQGFASGFSFLSGGTLPTSCNCEPDFISFNLNLYMQFIQDPYLCHMIMCLQRFPSLQDFVPSSAYGEFLFYTYKGSEYFVPKKAMYFQSLFLDKLNAASYVLKENRINVILIAGDGESTIEHLEIMPACTREKWYDGKAINCTLSSEGDGCSLTRSVFGIDGFQYTFRADYGELLLQAATILPSLL